MQIPLTVILFIHNHLSILFVTLNSYNEDMIFIIELAITLAPPIKLAIKPAPIIMQISLVVIIFIHTHLSILFVTLNQTLSNP